MLRQRWAEQSWALAAGQRKLLAGIFAIVAVYAGVRLLIDRRPIADPQPPRGDHWADLADQLDPNTADWTELAALPGLGEKRAHAIVDYRLLHARGGSTAHGESTAVFRVPEDLYNVRGFGYAMVEQMKQYMRFPGATLATRPTPASAG